MLGEDSSFPFQGFNLVIDAPRPVRRLRIRFIRLRSMGGKCDVVDADGVVSSSLSLAKEVIVLACPTTVGSLPRTSLEPPGGLLLPVALRISGVKFCVWFAITLHSA